MSRCHKLGQIAAAAGGRSAGGGAAGRRCGRGGREPAAGRGQRQARRDRSRARRRGGLRQARRLRRFDAAQLVQLLQHGVERHGVARLDGLEQRDFDENFLGGGVAQAQFRVGQHFQDARQRFGVGQGGSAPSARPLPLRKLPAGSNRRAKPGKSAGCGNGSAIRRAAGRGPCRRCASSFNCASAVSISPARTALAQFQESGFARPGRTSRARRPPRFCRRKS